MTIHEALRLMQSRKASDLHLTVGNPPAFRVNGQIQAAEELGAVDGKELGGELGALLSQEQRDLFHKDLELDFAIEFPEMGRFRGNACVERGQVSLVFRRVTDFTPSIDSLGLPAVCRQVALKPRGLVVVTGPTGSGKSTTLAAMVEHINATAPRRVVTLEDPIEYLFRNGRSVITQREIGRDARSFAEALNHVLRQNPDVIMVGEMRDAATVAAALTASETGHLVLTTSHAPSASQTIDRITDMFPPHQQGQVRGQLSSILEAVFYQQLVPRADGKGRVAAVEIMLGTGAVRNLIREGKVHQLNSAIQLGLAQGMQTFDQALARLCREGVIKEQDAMAFTPSPDQLRRELGLATAGGDPRGPGIAGGNGKGPALFGAPRSRGPQAGLA